MRSGVSKPLWLQSAGDEKVVSRALRGVRAVICPGKLGAVLCTAARQQLEHIVLLSSAGRCYCCCSSFRMLSSSGWMFIHKSKPCAVMTCNRHAGCNVHAQVFAKPALRSFLLVQGSISLRPLISAFFLGQSRACSGIANVNRRLKRVVFPTLLYALARSRTCQEPV